MNSFLNSESNRFVLIHSFLPSLPPSFPTPLPLSPTGGQEADDEEYDGEGGHDCADGDDGCHDGGVDVFADRQLEETQHGDESGKAHVQADARARHAAA